jgi:hypothetical protein
VQLPPLLLLLVVVGLRIASCACSNLPAIATWTGKWELRKRRKVSQIISTYVATINIRSWPIIDQKSSIRNNTVQYMDIRENVLKTCQPVILLPESAARLFKLRM